MAKVVNCECGEVVRADTDDELVQKVDRHVEEAHPELIGTMSREDALARAEEVVNGLRACGGVRSAR